MKPPTRLESAFTLPEATIACGIVALVGAMIFTVLNIGITLYAQNVSINQTHSGGLFSTERILGKVTAAVEVPGLVDEAGATIAGNGPAAGVRFFSPASSPAYAVPSAVGATATSFTITRLLSQPAPQAGDKITMADLGFQGVITSVSTSGSSSTVGFASAVGNGFSPVKTAGTVIPAGSKCFLLSPSAFISVNSELRYYPRALSVVQHGATAFNSPANFDPVAKLLPIGGATNGLPFQYLDAARRSVDVNLRVCSSAHGGRLKGFYTFHNMKTTVAYRSTLSQ